jgi:5-formyltetrahydrofolate cyclo-ligase
MWAVSISERKRALRAAMLSQRARLSKVDSLSWSRLIQAQVLQFSPYLTCRSVALYSPMQNEVETGEIRYHALSAGKSVFLPRFGNEDSVELVEIGSPAELKSGRSGFLEPSGEKRLSPQAFGELALLAPAVAVDSRGNRLGRGKAWYDRLIKELNGAANVAALAYEFQIVDEVPSDEWDQQVDYVITERRVIDCRSMAIKSNESS